MTITVYFHSNITFIRLRTSYFPWEVGPFAYGLLLCAPWLLFLGSEDHLTPNSESPGAPGWLRRLGWLEGSGKIVMAEVKT